MTHEEAIALLKGSEEHRILRRVFRRPAVPMPEAEPLKRGLYVDVETTGLNHETDTIIEIAAVPFRYHDDVVVDVGEPFHSFQHSPKPLEPEIVSLTGLTDAMIAGKEIDKPALANVVDEADVIIAHHAEFDRQFCEKLLSNFARKPWGCTYRQVDWRAHGIAGSKLDYIAMALGFFFDGHRAINDAEAAVFLLNEQLSDGRTILAHLGDRMWKDTRRVWAINAPYQKKDFLKRRKYEWNNGDDKRMKAWHREIDDDQVDDEIAWLRKYVYGTHGTMGGRMTRITPLDRFTKRG